MDPRYILFVKKECPFCIDAIELLDQNKLLYKVVNFEPDQENTLNEIKIAHGHSTVPMIFYRDKNDIKLVGGFTDLQKWLVND